ncbi:MAG: tetratricopeptide repeat protein [Candidatus Omnitrophica bacterium]|nr:tetratricopeptide repeat protein [Candidatus Omnitrophota bacterium]
MKNLIFFVFLISFFFLNAHAVIGEGSKIEQGLNLLKSRKDKEALLIFSEILKEDPFNLDGLWGKAEVLRRTGNIKEARELLNQILDRAPKHTKSLISLAYIKYKENDLTEAKRLVYNVLKDEASNKESQALGYIILSGIDTKYSANNGILSKLRYSVKIKSYIFQAHKLAPELPEVNLALGTFYLLAPGFLGGNLEKAIETLEYTVKLAPDFATANARLAQAYKNKGDLEKYNFYLECAKNLDPYNELLKELTEEK